MATWIRSACETNGINIHYLRTGGYKPPLIAQHHRFLGLSKNDALAQARLRHLHRSSEFVELITEARLQTRINAFDVLAPPNPDYRELVSTIGVPILLIIGDKGIVSLETAQELQRPNRRLRLELISDVGDGLPYDRPDCFAAVVSSFLRSVVAL
jgi:pimeloyl-ACP methyl ester carboxylesterase